MAKIISGEEKLSLGYKIETGEIKINNLILNKQEIQELINFLVGIGLLKRM